MKLRHGTLMVISGLIWLVIGAFLMRLGLTLTAQGLEPVSGNAAGPLIYFLVSVTGHANIATMIIVVAALGIGYLKGNYVLRKSAQRTISRVRTLPNPASITNLFTAPYILLICLMMLLGFLIKWFELSPDIRGFVDIAIGTALIQGASHYFRAASLKESPGT